MAEYQEKSSQLLSVSSSENRDSIDSSKAQADGEDEEFYEKIEAPKFVDFTVPDHYRPDDRYWFCLRVGCDQKHEEEMDSEAIYKNFVLRVIAARSPNVRLRKALDRCNASRTPVKCPLSAPPKSSKPRLSRMAIISSISKKMVDDKKKVVRPLLKSGSTPLTKTKPVAAKYLTTPRNKKCKPNQSSFRSAQNPKPVNVEVEKSRIVAKALVFHSPKKAIKVKTSVELRTPISKLCEGMKKLEISSQRKRTLGYSSKSSKNLSNSLSVRQLSSRKVQRKPKEPHRTSSNQEAKTGRSIKTKTRGELSKQDASTKYLGSDHKYSLKNNESYDIKQQLAKKVAEEFGLKESTHEEGSDLASLDDSKREINCLDFQGSNTSRSQVIHTKENNNSNSGNENITSESCGELLDNLNVNNSSEGERNGHEFMDGDDKENAAVSDENRKHNNNLKQNGRKIFGTHDKSQVKKKVIQAQDNNLKEGSSGQVMKLKKPKATNPKPFRLRTDERRILKEANLERRTDPLAPQSENANSSTPCGKLQRKQGSDIQKRSMVVGLKIPKGQERSKAAASMTPERNNKSQERKLMSSPLGSTAMQRLEKFKKIISPLPKQSLRPQGISTKQEMSSCLIPGQKLEVIHETSPEVSERSRGVGKPPTQSASPFDDGGAASRTSSCGRRPITEPSFHTTHVPRSCTKKVK